jgi:glycosyltransferase involved in cell wall biosynthesis
LAERPKRIVFMGRKAKSKGVGDLIDAMQLVWSEMPDAELRIAGVRLPETAEVDRQIAALPDAWRHQVKDVGTIFEAEKSEFFRIGTLSCPAVEVRIVWDGDSRSMGACHAGRHAG